MIIVRFRGVNKDYYFLGLDHHEPDEVFDFFWAEIEKRDEIIDQQEEEIMDRNYFIAQLKSVDKKWVTEETEDKLIKEGLKVKERIKELDEQLNQKQ